MKFDIKLLSIIGFSLSACITTNALKPISQEEYFSEREQRLDRIDNFLVKSQRAIFEDRTRFDSCFEKNEKGIRVALTLFGPKSGKFTVGQISPPENLKDEDKFRTCVRVALNRIEMPLDNETSAQLMVVIFPSSVEPSTTKIHPKEYQIPPNRICLGLQRQFYKLKKWDLRKRNDGFVSDTYTKFATEDLFVCSGENLRKQFPWDLSEIKEKYPNEELEGYFVADGFE